MSFCRNCGTELQGGAVFCSNCGTKAPEEVQQGTVGNEQNIPPVNPNMNQYTNVNPYTNVNLNPNVYPNANGNTGFNDNVKQVVNSIPNVDTILQGKNKNIIIGVAAAAVVALIALFVIIAAVVFRTPAYEKPLKNFTDALEDGNYDKLISCYPDYLQDSIEEEMEYYGDEDDAMDAMLEGLEDEYGKHIKISYKITDKDKLDKDDLEDLEEYIDDYYDEKVNIKAGYELEAEMTIKGSEDDDTEDADFTVIKIGSKWYFGDDFLGW